jgi:hypothetical protein
VATEVCEVNTGACILRTSESVVAVAVTRKRKYDMILQVVHLEG